MAVLMIHVYTFAYNEEALMPYFLRHYGSFADRIVIHDNGSTDRTRQIAGAHPKVEVRDWDTGGRYDNVALIGLKNHCWKESRGQADWVIVCDFDEFLYHKALPEYLQTLKRSGVKVPKVSGWQMVSDEGPTGDGQLYDRIFLGASDSTWYGKQIIFDPQIEEIRYDLGAHHARPSEPAQPSELNLLHFRFIGVEFDFARSRGIRDRLDPAVEGERWEKYNRTREQIAQMIRDVRAKSVRVVPEPEQRPTS
jgi:hypothetical protein